MSYQVGDQILFKVWERNEHDEYIEKQLEGQIVGYNPNGYLRQKRYKVLVISVNGEFIEFTSGVRIIKKLNNKLEV